MKANEEKIKAIARSSAQLKFSTKQNKMRSMKNKTLGEVLAAKGESGQGENQKEHSKYCTVQFVAIDIC